MNLGVQSWCLRNTRDLAAVATQTRQCDVAAIELCDVHCDFSKPEEATKAAGVFQRAGVRVLSIGVQSFQGDAKLADRCFQSAQALGARHISAHFAVDTFQRAVPMAAELCEKYDIQIGLHCHGGFMFGGQPDVLAHLLQLGGQRFGVCLDTAWCLQIGPRHGKPVAWVRERFPGRISCVHFKDFTFTPAGQWQDMIVGSGNLDLPAFASALVDTHFDGLAIIECDRDPDNPVPQLQACVQRVRAALAAPRQANTELAISR